MRVSYRDEMEQTDAATADDTDVAPGTWSWLKEWTGYLVTLLPYVSSGIVLIPGLSIVMKVIIIVVFALVVLAIRVVHEKAGIEVTGDAKRRKKPAALK